jgi:drug/metabolite transporter (DMT)-like permease
MHDLPEQPRRLPRLHVVLAFVAIYVVWGSTFLAIRFAVESIPPLVAAGSRHLVAGAILLAWAWSRGEQPTRAAWRNGLILGFLFFFISHGLLHWGELTVPSGMAALIIAIEPAIVALLLPLLRLGPAPRLATYGGLILGALSVIVLFRPEVTTDTAVLIGLLAVLGSAVAWAVGIVYARRLQTSEDSAMNAALPLISGSVMLFIGALVVGEFQRFDIDQVTQRSVVGLVYLIVFGSLVAFTAYSWLLKHFPPTLVATHAYVNPIVAVLLGWLLAGEEITIFIVLSTILAISAIFLVNRGSTADG